MSYITVDDINDRIEHTNVRIKSTGGKFTILLGTEGIENLSIEEATELINDILKII